MQVSVISFTFMISCVEILCAYLHSHNPHNIFFIFNPNRNDGEEPDYMAINPTQWLSSSMSACCEKFFGGYMYDACMGRYPPDHDDCNVMLFYPDWEGANIFCVSDGK